MKDSCLFLAAGNLPTPVRPSREPPFGGGRQDCFYALRLGPVRGEGFSIPSVNIKQALLVIENKYTIT